MLNVCVPTFLARQLQAIEREPGSSARKLLQQFERVLAISLSRSAKQLSQLRPLQWSTFLPLKQLTRADNQQIRRFYEIRMAQWAEQLIVSGQAV